MTRRIRVGIHPGEAPEMHPLLRPMPMSTDEVADLVRRVRLLDREQNDARRLRVAKYQAERVLPSTTRTRCAARYANLVGCSLPDAATTFGLRALKWIRRAWRLMYPDERPPRERRDLRAGRPS